MNRPPAKAGDRPKPVGEVGEDFVEWMCESPFGKDFLFRGQKYRDGSNEIELCDLLLLLDDTAVLWEVKTADRSVKSGWTDEQWADWANKRLGKALSQVERGATALLTGLVKTVENVRQGQVSITPAQIKQVYGVALVDHPKLDKYGRAPSFEAAGRRVSVLTASHSELQDRRPTRETPKSSSRTSRTMTST